MSSDHWASGMACSDGIPLLLLSMFNSKRSSTLTRTAALSTYGAAPNTNPAPAINATTLRLGPNSLSRATMIANGTNMMIGNIFVPNAPNGITKLAMAYSLARPCAVALSAIGPMSTVAQQMMATVQVSGIP